MVLSASGTICFQSMALFLACGTLRPAPRVALLTARQPCFFRLPITSCHHVGYDEGNERAVCPKGREDPEAGLTTPTVKGFLLRRTLKPRQPSGGRFLTLHPIGMSKG